MIGRVPAVVAIDQQRARRGVGLLGGSAIALCIISILYGISGYLDSRTPQANPGNLARGLVWFTACAGIIAAHGLRSPSIQTDPPVLLRVLLLSLVVVPTLYVVSYFRYLTLGATAGTLVGALAGIYLFTRLRTSVSQRAASPLAAIFLGASIFFVLQDVCFDTLTMGSNTLAPRIRQGQKVSVDKSAFGLRIPFWSYYLISWGSPSKGDIVAFLLDDGRLFIKEVVAVKGGLTEVKDIGIIPRSRLRGKVEIVSG